jgi:hypothetical protein
MKKHILFLLRNKTKHSSFALEILDDADSDTLNSNLMSFGNFSNLKADTDIIIYSDESLFAEIQALYADFNLPISFRSNKNVNLDAMMNNDNL